EADAFFADGVQLGFGAIGAQPIEYTAAFADQVRVEGARESAIRCDYNDSSTTHRLRLPQKRVTLLQLGIDQTADHAEQALGIRTCRINTVGGSLQLRSRDHLHGLRDLARLLDRRDAPF